MVGESQSPRLQMRGGGVFVSCLGRGSVTYEVAVRSPLLLMMMLMLFLLLLLLLL